MKSALIQLLLLASFGLWGLESSNRFALYGDLEEEQQRLGTLWAMDISESLDLQALSLQGGIQHVCSLSELLGGWT
ncbi:MAG: hypothetical protein LRZ88_09355 [Candidatus Cloacimonetes bacterium]|nr:hypothetical protein [Candidatus Cloacimonadota bacterium]